MEVNVTIIIQALILLMLFVFSSKLLFNPLKEMFSKRLELTSNEELKISTLKNEVVKQQYYLIRVVFLMKNKINRQNTYLKRIHEFYRRKHKKIVKFRNNEKNKNVIFKLQCEFYIAKSKIFKEKTNIVKDILKRLSNNQ